MKEYEWVPTRRGLKGCCRYLYWPAYESLWGMPIAIFISNEDKFLIHQKGDFPLSEPLQFDFPKELKLVRDKKRYVETFFRLEGYIDEV